MSQIKRCIQEKEKKIYNATLIDTVFARCLHTLAAERRADV